MPSEDRRRTKKSRLSLTTDRPANQSPKRSSGDRPSPQEFDEFIPWMCLQFMSPNFVTVTRIYREDYARASINRRASTKSAKSVTNKQAEIQEVALTEYTVTPVYDGNIQIKAYYNFFGQLQEVSVVRSRFNINRIVIKSLCIAVPFHQTLTKLTISRGGLTATALLEIGKILPQSFLTDICLDDTNVPKKQNYTVLLEAASRLRNLSLNRCRLGDETCKEIVACIDIGSELRTLQLSSNQISDEGAFAFADLLRRNRRLLHLNLSGNFITDEGASAILDTLKEFPLSSKEILDIKLKRWTYNLEKIKTYELYLKDMMITKQNSHAHSRSRSKSIRTAVSSKVKSPVLNKTLKKSPTLGSAHTSPSAEKRTNNSHPDLEHEARGTFGVLLDPYDVDHLVLKDRHFYCIGNMCLCFLNLAYNSLDYTSVQKIKTVLVYQSEANRLHSFTGLLKINFEGNCMPRHCDEYVQIEMLLQDDVGKQLHKRVSVPRKKTSSRKYVDNVSA